MAEPRKCINSDTFRRVFGVKNAGSRLAMTVPVLMMSAGPQ
jgi:hypothetical protein